MIEINEELRELYRTDYFPARENVLKKELKLYFPELGKTVSNENIYSESMTLNESICSDTDLTFGGCEAAQFEITIAGVGDEVIGKEMIVTQTVDDRFDMPFGTYIVKSAKKKDGMDFKEILSYDRMTESDVDVSGWYNGLQFPMTVKQFRLSLYAQLGYAYVEQDLPNDTVVIQKTINPSYIKGRDILKAIGEFNGRFGHFTREDKFKYVGLGGIGLYPSETLYPSEGIYPSEPIDYITGSRYKSVRYEDYIVEPIDSLQIRQEEGDVGIVVGDTTNNPYIIQGNFLCYGMDAATLKMVADSILLNVKNKYYRPHTTILKGLPYLEVGDSVAVIMDSDVVESFIFNRTLSGIQALTDEYSASGSQTRKNEVSPSVQIEQLREKTMRIDKSVDGLQVELSDLEDNTNEKFEMTNGQIVLKVDANGRIVQAELTSDPEDGSTFQVKADNIILEGLVTANENFKISADGSIEAKNGRFSGEITSSSATITGGTINIDSSGENNDIIKLTYGSQVSVMRASGFTTSYAGLYSRIGGESSTFKGTVSIATLEPDKIKKLTGALDITATTINLDGYVEVEQTLKCYKKVTALSGLTVNGSYSNMLDVDSSTVKVGNTSCSVGFFGSSGGSKQTVYAISVPSSATATTNAQKINEIINALKSYGLM